MCYRGQVAKPVQSCGGNFGLGCFLISGESLCNKSMEQSWMLGQDRKIILYSKTGEIWNLRTCEKEISLREKNGQ